MGEVEQFLQVDVATLKKDVYPDDSQARSKFLKSVLCPNNHRLTKKKDALKWHQVKGRVQGRECDACAKEIPSDGAVWRCLQHCDYDICLECFGQAVSDTTRFIAAKSSASPAAGGAQDAAHLDVEQLEKLMTSMSPEQRVQVMEAIAGVAEPPRALEEKHAVGSTPKSLQRSSSEVKNWYETVAQVTSSALYEEYQGLLSEAQAEYSGAIPDFGPGDCLLIVDMQNDFVPAADAPDGGRFAVSDGAGASAVIVEMTSKAAAANAMVVATRDYHPLNHCSFITRSGPFPAHCVQGTKGSFFFPPIAQALSDANARGADMRVVFKGFHEGVDSFGGLRYGERYFVERSLGNAAGAKPGDMSQGCCMLDWTGSFCLECSNISADINAPPDVLSPFGRKALGDELAAAGIRRLFVTGLALDFCVLDSALNASAAGLAPDGVFLVVDAARAAHIPGVGSFGSGFLSDPHDIVKKTSAQGVKLIKSEAMCMNALRTCQFLPHANQSSEHD